MSESLLAGTDAGFADNSYQDTDNGLGWDDDGEQSADAANVLFDENEGPEELLDQKKAMNKKFTQTQQELKEQLRLAKAYEQKAQAWEQLMQHPQAKDMAMKIANGQSFEDPGAISDDMDMPFDDVEPALLKYLEGRFGQFEKKISQQIQPQAQMLSQIRVESQVNNLKKKYPDVFTEEVRQKLAKSFQRGENQTDSIELEFLRIIGPKALQENRKYREFARKRASVEPSGSALGTIPVQPGSFGEAAAKALREHGLTLEG